MFNHSITEMRIICLHIFSSVERLKQAGPTRGMAAEHLVVMQWSGRSDVTWTQDTIWIFYLFFYLKARRHVHAKTRSICKLGVQYNEECSASAVFILELLWIWRSEAKQTLATELSRPIKLADSFEFYRSQQKWEDIAFVQCHCETVVGFEAPRMLCTSNARAVRLHFSYIGFVGFAALQ